MNPIGVHPKVVPYRCKEYRDALLNQPNGAAGRQSRAGESVREALVHEYEWRDLRGKVFVLIGATSEMGPTDCLLRCGATVVALARPASKRNPEKWARLISRADESPGTLLYPMTGAVPGADALSQTPEIINWLEGLFMSHPLCGHAAHLSHHQMPGSLCERRSQRGH